MEPNNKNDRPSLRRIKSGALSRGLALARVSVAASAKAATHLAGSLLASPEEKSDRLRALLGAQVGMLARELGQLKGSLMKVGQMLSMYGEQVLPPEVNALLKSLQSQSPPLAWEAIAPVIHKQLGANEALVEIEREPVGSASLGQVHRARRKSDDARIAMKIQYPGVDRAIDSDLATLRRVLALSKIIPRSEGKHKVDDLFKEVRQMLHQEVDYVREREATERFRERLAEDPRYHVPRTFPELSSRRVLSTEYVDGVNLDSSEVKALSQERRNALAAALLELYFRELLVFNEVQTDPHFGNYRVELGDGSAPDRLVLFDFGAVRAFPKSFREPYLEMLRGTFLRDSGLVVRSAMKLGFLIEEDPEETRRKFAEICFLFGEPVSTEAPYDWGASDLPKRLARQGGELALTLRFRSPPREVIFLDRKMAGIFFALATLGAKISVRGLFGKYLETVRSLNS